MDRFRNLASLGLGLLLSSFLLVTSGCGGSPSEVDSAERILNEAPKPAEPAPASPANDAPVAKEAPKG